MNPESLGIITRLAQESQKISITKLAEEFGFNTKEKKAMLKLYFEPLFNRRKILLTDKMIRENLTNDTSEHAIRNFYRKLRQSPEFEERVDYDLILGRDLLEHHEHLKSNGSEINGEEINPIKYYCFVTGEIYKRLMMMAKTSQGVLTRTYFGKIEELVLAN